MSISDNFVSIMRAWCAGLLLASLGCVSSFYLPGLAPVTYCDNSEIQGCTSDIKLFVNNCLSLFALSMSLSTFYDLILSPFIPASETWI